MDLTLTRRGDYAVRAAISLAEAWPIEGFRKAADISAAMDIPRSYVAQVLGGLVTAGLVEGRAGREGGYRLTRPPAEMTVLDVVEATEGALASQRCPIRGGPCRWESVCAVHPTWMRVSEAVREAMRGSTLASVAAEDARIADRTVADPRGTARR